MKICKILQNFAKFWRNFENWCEGLQNSSDLAGESCTVWKTLQNAPTLAIVAVHTAENEPPKVLKTPEKNIYFKQCRLSSNTRSENLQRRGTSTAMIINSYFSQRNTVVSYYRHVHHATQWTCNLKCWQDNTEFNARVKSSGKKK